MTVGVAEVHRQRVAVILVSELDAVRAEALLRGVEIVDDDRDMPETGRLRLTGGRLSLRLNNPNCRPG